MTRLRVGVYREFRYHKKRRKIYADYNDVGEWHTKNADFISDVLRFYLRKGRW